jgi:exopolyphosphatase/guanosine-5'-triphosphate,3'-diphosphate pyrophosphatase
MKIAIIDLGTNTFHLLIVDVLPDGTYQILEKIKTAVKLGKNGMNTGIITPASFWRGMQAVKRYHKKAVAYQVQNIYAYGTSAVRNAENGAEFIAQVKAKTGIEIQAISGEKEAEYIYFGVREALKMGAKESLIMDIGGGSVEFIIANNKEVFWKKSYEIGAARLLEQFKPTNPISSVQVTALKSFMSKEFEELFEQAELHQISTLIGSSGSFDTFADIISANFKGGSSRLSSHTLSFDFNLKDFQLIYIELLNSTTEQRKKMKGMIAMRVDMIVVSAIMVHLMLEQLPIKKMKLSTYALKEGVLWKIMQTPKQLEQ